MPRASYIAPPSGTFCSGSSRPSMSCMMSAPRRVWERQRVRKWGREWGRRRVHSNNKCESKCMLCKLLGLLCWQLPFLGTVCEQVRGRYRLPRQIPVAEVADPVLPSSSRLSSHHQQRLPMTVRIFLSACCSAFHLSIFPFQPSNRKSTTTEL